MSLLDFGGAFIIFLIALIAAYIGFHILAHFSHSEEKPVVGKQPIRLVILLGFVCCALNLVGLPVDLLSNASK